MSKKSTLVGVIALSVGLLSFAFVMKAHNETKQEQKQVAEAEQFKKNFLR